MNTLTFTLATANPATPIKNLINQKIEDFKAEKAKHAKAISTRVNEMFKMQTEIMEQLNKEVGADVWFLDKRNVGRYTLYYGRTHINRDRNPCFGVSIGFRDGVYKNTCYNDWDLIIQTPWSDEIKMADMSYRIPNLDVIEIYLVQTENNEKHNVSKQISHKITDLSQVHKFLENDYLTYFATSK